MSSTIVHFRNGIGNFISLTPALQALASMDASGKIDICTDREWYDSRKQPLLDIWERLPFINHIYAVDEITDKPYKTWFWTQWNSHGRSKELFERKKYYEMNWNQLTTHESEYYMDIVRVHYGYKGDTPPMTIVPAEGPTLDRSKKNVVLTNGGFGEYCVMKKWSKFGELAKEIKNLFSDVVSVIKVGAKNELSDVKDYDVDYVDKLTMAQSARVIQQADVVLADDTGNMHVADALGVPLIVLWGGSIVSKNRPINSKCKIIHLGLECQPCQQDSGYAHCEDIKCLNDIHIGEVMYYLRRFLIRGRFE